MPFGKFIHHRVDEIVFFGLKPEDLNAREIANTFAFPLAKSIFDILRHDGYKIGFAEIAHARQSMQASLPSLNRNFLRGFCDYLVEKL